MKRLILMLCLVFLFGAVAMSFDVSAALSGKCGDTLTWNYDGDTLVISGSGDMYDYDPDNGTPAPWGDYTSQIKSINISDDVTYIGDYAFKSCSYVTELKLPKSLKGIGDSAFSMCGEIQSIVIPEGVIEIGNKAFMYCTQAKEIVFPDTLVTIGDDAFFSCSSAISIVLPDSVVQIGRASFNCMNKLSNIKFSASMTEIPDDAFAMCGLIENLVIPGNIKTIGACAFYDGNIKNIVLENGVETIKASAFNPNTVTMPDSVKYIDKYTFGMPNSVKFICSQGSYADNYAKAHGHPVEYTVFYTTGKCGDALEWTFDNGTLTISGTGEMYDYGMAEIGTDNAGENSAPWYVFNNRINKIVIEDGVTGIGTYAFERHRNITSVVIGKDVCEIGDYAFSGCRNLSDIIWGNSLRRIGVHSFEYCAAIESIELPDGLETIDSGAFFNLAVLKTVILPDSITAICGGAFGSCTELETINIPKNITKINDNTFAFCKKLREITIPDGVSMIGDGAFGDCNRLESIVIPDSVTYISDTAFFNNNIIPVLVISCSRDSYAAEYAHAHNIAIDGEYYDVAETAWYYDSVVYVSGAGYMLGTAKGYFSPDGALTREQFVQILFAISGWDKSQYTGPSGFIDVPEGKWYSPAIKWAQQNAITAGDGNGRFLLGSIITREQLAQFMYNYMSLRGKDLSGTVDIDMYEDVDSISDWAQTAIKWAVDRGVFTSTMPDRYFLAPKATATRAVAARVVVVYDRLLHTGS